MSNIRKRAIAIPAKGDTISLDTLSIIPGTLHISMTRIVIDSNVSGSFSEDVQILLRRTNPKDKNDTISYGYEDTFRVVPSPLKVTKYKVEPDSTYFKILPEDGKIVLNRKKMLAAGIKMDTVSSTYRAFPYLFSH